MNDNVLILAPHTDDGELGCGGAIAKYLEEGNNVYYVAFSSCQDSIPEGYPKDILKHELNKAMSCLGVERDHVRILDYPVRRFGEFRQNILDDMIKLNREINPSMVFSTSPRDIHQDHYVIAKEAMRALKKRLYLLMKYHGIILNFIIRLLLHWKRSISKRRYRQLAVMIRKGTDRIHPVILQLDSRGYMVRKLEENMQKCLK